MRLVMAKMVAIYSNELLFKHSNTIIWEHNTSWNQEQTYGGTETRRRDCPIKFWSESWYCQKKLGIKFNLCSFWVFLQQVCRMPLYEIRFTILHNATQLHIHILSTNGKGRIIPCFSWPCLSVETTYFNFF